MACLINKWSNQSKTCTLYSACTWQLNFVCSVSYQAQWKTRLLMCNCKINVIQSQVKLKKKNQHQASKFWYMYVLKISPLKCFTFFFSWHLQLKYIRKWITTTHSKKWLPLSSVVYSSFFKLWWQRCLPGFCLKIQKLWLI